MPLIRCHQRSTLRLLPKLIPTTRHIFEGDQSQRECPSNTCQKSEDTVVNDSMAVFSVKMMSGWPLAGAADLYLLLLDAIVSIPGSAAFHCWELGPYFVHNGEHP